MLKLLVNDQYRDILDIVYTVKEVYGEQAADTVHGYMWGADLVLPPHLSRQLLALIESKKSALLKPQPGLYLVA